MPKQRREYAIMQLSPKIHVLEAWSPVQQHGGDGTLRGDSVFKRD
jgi:hypothetical protein